MYKLYMYVCFMLSSNFLNACPRINLIEPREWKIIQLSVFNQIPSLNREETNSIGAHFSELLGVMG